jgi:protein ImuA
MRLVVAHGGNIVVVGPPKSPHLPGLRHAGLDERQLVWIQAEAPAERLWVTEQLVKTNAAGLLVSWLPQARQEQIRRLQVCALASDGPVFLCRPAAAEHEPSAAPLRVQLRFGLDWELHVHLLKRKGPTHEGDIALKSVPGGLESILTPRLRTPSEFIAARQVRELPDVVGSPAPRQAPVRRVAAH